jgi:transcriptional regulator with XRE-family HTH domain
LKKQRVTDNSFAIRLKDIRKSLKLTKEKFAQKMNISPTNLSDIENGKTRPCHDFFYRVLNDFKVNLNYLVSGEGHMFIETGNDKDAASEEEGNRFYIDVDHEDVRLFLEYFSKSKIMKYRLLAAFLHIMNEEDESINKEFDRMKPKSGIKSQENPEKKEPTKNE